MKAIKLLVFDLDGTLVDGPLNFAPFREEFDLDKGAPLLEFIDTLDCSQKRSYCHQRIKEIEQEAAQKAKPKKFALEVLETLKERSIKMAIWTRNSNEATEISLKVLGPYFSHIQTRENSTPKPAIHGMNNILSQFKVSSGETLYIGDSHYDIEGGSKAGVKTLILKNERLGHFDSLPPQVSLIDNLKEIFHHI